MVADIMTYKAFLEGLEKYNLQGDDEAKRVALLNALAEKNAKRANTPTQKQKDNEPIKKQIVDYLTNEGKEVLSADIAKALQLSPQKVNGLARILVGEGVVAVVPVKVKGKGEQKAYKIV